MHLATFCLLLCLQLAGSSLLPIRRPPGPTLHIDNWVFESGLKNFAVLAPSRYRPGRPYSVAVSLLSSVDASSSLARVDASLACAASRLGFDGLSASAVWTPPAPSALFADATTVIAPQDSVVVTLKVDKLPKKLDLSAECKLTVSLRDTAGREFSDSGDVTISAVRSEIFIQTDKAIYKPGQAVKFRVVSVSESLKPIFCNLTAYVRDAEGNLVDRFQHRPSSLISANLTDAVMSGQFQLSDQPNLGDWSIIAETDSGKETKTFTVDRYVLPKLELQLTPPDFVHVNDTEFVVTAQPKYTYDKAADGELTVNVTVLHTCQGNSGGFHRGYSNCNVTLTAIGGLGAAATSEQLLSGKPVELKFSLVDWGAQLAKRGLQITRWGGVSALISGQFVERFSGVKILANKKFTIYKSRYQLTLDTGAAQFVLPGMTVPVQMKLVRPDGKPYTGPMGHPGNVTLRMSWSVRGVGATALVYNAPAPTAERADWTVPALVPENADFSGVSFEATCPGLPGKMYANLRPFETRGSAAVRLELLPASPGVGSPGDLTIAVHRGDGVIGKVFCAIVNQEGGLSNWYPLTYPSPTVASHSLTLRASQVATLLPKFTVVAVGFHGNELVATAEAFQPAGSYDGVRLSSNVTTAAAPQQLVNVKVEAGPDSIVFLTGIDHSVNLMKTGQDISADVIEQRVAAAPKAGTEGNRWWSPSPTTGSELQKAGLIVLTDFKYVKNERPMYAMRGGMEMEDGIMFAGGVAVPQAAKASREMAKSSPSRDESSNSKKPTESLQVRKFFPESFIWTWLRTDATGTASHDVSLPDTITSWDVTAFALSTRRPLQGTRKPLNIVSRKAFFIRPVLPYSLIRGEKFLLKVLVFNYGDVALATSVTLEADPSLRLLGSDGNSRLTLVPAGGSNITVFSVEPIQLPEMRLSLRAVAAEAAQADSVERRIRVDAEGAIQRRVATALLNLTGVHGGVSLLTLNFPPAGAWQNGRQLVPDSEYARVQVTGTVLGASVSNLEGLLRMPYGCGEQNMINFAPAVFVLDCLGPTEATQEVADKAVRIMKTGYQRELTYRRSDGSYSAFGNSDPAGSTWLTAFVLSVYAQAAQFIPIDPEALSGASLSYLLGKQLQNGSFVETGRVIHADMQGAGASGAAGLTAYVCACLLRVMQACQSRPELRAASWNAAGRDATKAALRRGLRFVYADYAARPGDFRPSDLAVAAYAARLTAMGDSRDAGDVSAAEADAEAKVANFLWMQLYEASKPEGDDRRYWPGGASGSGSGSAETTGYALMTALLRGDLEAAVPALRWLSASQGDLGGFQSTQDTVVGLQAMAQFAKAHPSGDGVGAVSVTWPGQAQPLRFWLGPDNRTLLQRRELGRGDAARPTSDVSVSGSGSGVALVTVVYSYNLRDAPAEWIGPDWIVRGGVGLRLLTGAGAPGPLGGFAPPDSTVELTVCAKASSGLGMYIVTLTNPSGFSVDAHTPISGLVSKVEPGADKLVFYLSELTDEICLSARWIREIPVLDLNPQRITVQNYYQPDQEISLFHLHPKLTGLTECSVCPDCPKCRKPERSEL